MISTDVYINNLVAIRKNALSIVDGLTDFQLTQIPEGFNNNLLWQLGHIVTSGQGLSYRLSGLEQGIPAEYVKLFGKGSAPHLWESTPDIAQIKTLLLSTLEQTREDIKKDIFKTFTKLDTSLGITVQSFEESLVLRNIHEGLHLGYIMALRKLVK